MGKVFMTSPLNLSIPPTYYCGIKDKTGRKTRVRFTGDNATIWCKLHVS